MKMNKLFAGLSVLAFSALMLTGCGGPSPNKVHSVEDLKGKRIGVQQGTTADTLASDLENTTVEAYDKASDAIAELQSGKIDAVIVDMETANTFIESNDDIMVLDEALSEEEYAIAVNLENDVLCNELNTAFQALIQDGTLPMIKANYEGDEKGTHPYEVKVGAPRDRGTLVMATNAEFPPYESIEDEVIVGFDIDMMNAVCDYLGYELVINDMPFDEVIPAVRAAKADVGVAALSITPDRQEKVMFTNVYAKTRQVVVVRSK